MRLGKEQNIFHWLSHMLGQTYKSRQLMFNSLFFCAVMYLQANPGGITIFGWTVDRALINTIFFIELSLVTFVLGKTIVNSNWPSTSWGLLNDSFCVTQQKILRNIRFMRWNHHHFWGNFHHHIGCEFQVYLMMQFLDVTILACCMPR